VHFEWKNVIALVCFAPEYRIERWGAVSFCVDELFDGDGTSRAAARKL
jgi:hypothetical protein